MAWLAGIVARKGYRFVENSRVIGKISPLCWREALSGTLKPKPLLL